MNRLGSTTYFLVSCLMNRLSGTMYFSVFPALVANQWTFLTRQAEIQSVNTSVQWLKCWRWFAERFPERSPADDGSWVTMNCAWCLWLFLAAWVQGRPSSLGLWKSWNMLKQQPQNECICTHPPTHTQSDVYLSQSQLVENIPGKSK